MIIAASLKAIQVSLVLLGVYEMALMDMYVGMIQAVAESTLGCVVLFAGFNIARLLVVASYGAFLSISTIHLIRGVEDCGCFGVLSVPPEVSVFTGCLALMVAGISRPVPREGTSQEGRYGIDWKLTAILICSQVLAAGYLFLESHAHAFADRDYIACKDIDQLVAGGLTERVKAMGLARLPDGARIFVVDGRSSAGVNGLEKALAETVEPSSCIVAVDVNPQGQWELKGVVTYLPLKCDNRLFEFGEVQNGAARSLDTR